MLRCYVYAEIVLNVLFVFLFFGKDISLFEPMLAWSAVMFALVSDHDACVGYHISILNVFYLLGWC